jgi:hypothetical protein
MIWSRRSGVTLYQGAPGSKFSKAPIVEVLKAWVEHRICTSFLGGPGHVRPENFWIYTLWNAISWTLGRDFTEFWWSENDIVTYQRPWPMFLLYRLNLGAPIWPIEVGAPGFSRSEPIVVTPLSRRLYQKSSRLWLIVKKSRGEGSVPSHGNLKINKSNNIANRKLTIK